MSVKIKQNQIDYVEFPASSVSALQASKKFYGEVFGWSFQDWGDEYADTKDSGIGSGIAADPLHRTQGPLVVLYTTELETMRERIVNAGGTISKDIVSFPGGRRFHYMDPAGNQLGVWSDK
jgi:hypothetical protein